MVLLIGRGLNTYRLTWFCSSQLPGKLLRWAHPASEFTFALFRTPCVMPEPISLMFNKSVVKMHKSFCSGAGVWLLKYSRAISSAASKRWWPTAGTRLTSSLVVWPGIYEIYRDGEQPCRRAHESLSPSKFVKFLKDLERDPWLLGGSWHSAYVPYATLVLRATVMCMTPSCYGS